MADVPFEGFDKVRVGIIGVGARGMSLLRDLLAIEHVELKAICDIVPEYAERGRDMVTEKGQPAPGLYTDSETHFEELNARDDLDLVYIATPWNWHVPMAVDAMEKGKHVGLEVPAATTVEGCWDLVETSERTRKHCVMLENVCYGWSEMTVLNMVRQGLLGDVKHGEAAYIHDLRSLLFADYSEGLWRRYPHAERNGNFYPTHGLGPVANYMDINRGDRFLYMVALSSPEMNLTKYQEENVPEGDMRRQEAYVCGDINTGIIKTEKGRTIMLQHDVVSPRPYDRINLISGDKGCFRGFPDRLYIDGAEDHSWTDLSDYREEYESILWKQVGELARELGGHGGMDFIMSYRLIQCMREGLVPDMDVYDAAAWSVPTPLSQDSVAQDGAPQYFPDFTRGNAGYDRVPAITAGL
jgi:hypothetical protein